MYKYLRLIPVLCFIFSVTAVTVLTGCGKKGDVYSNMSAQQIYERGKKAAIRRDYSQAIVDFDTLEARYPYGEYTDKGQLALIHAYAQDEDEQSAIAAADRFIRVHPRHPHVDYAYYMKGVVNFNQNFSLVFRMMPLDRSLRESTFAQAAFDDFRTLIDKFPDSKYAPDAHKRMILLREQLADHELHIAEYYVNQGANLAAANRAGYVVNQFPRTGAVKPALEIMHKSYAAMNMPKESQEALATLQQNYGSHAQK